MDSQTGVKRRSGGSAAGPPKSGPPRSTEPVAKGEDHVVVFRLLDGPTKAPLGGARYEVMDAGGAVCARGKTEWHGTVSHAVKASGAYTIRVLEETS